jgi:hypothetical protein
MREREMKASLKIRIAALVFSFAVAVLLFAPHAAAQGCAMCYQNASAAGAQGSAALRHGILVLLLPTLSLFIGIFALIYHRRNVAR